MICDIVLLLKKSANCSTEKIGKLFYWTIVSYRLRAKQLLSANNSEILCFSYKMGSRMSRVSVITVWWTVLLTSREKKDSKKREMLTIWTSNYTLCSNSLQRIGNGHDASAERVRVWIHQWFVVFGGKRSFFTLWRSVTTFHIADFRTLKNYRVLSTVGVCFHHVSLGNRVRALLRPSGASNRRFLEIDFYWRIPL